MTGWTNARWTQARQIVELTDTRAARAIPEGRRLDEHFDQMLIDGKVEAAAFFAGIALPRLDGIVWAFDAIRAMPTAPEGDDAAMLEAIEAWIASPGDMLRRAVADLAERSESSPEQLLANAVFFSGGSIAPPDLPAVSPVDHISGQMAAAAVVSAAHRESDPEAWLDKAVRAADAIARKPRQ